MINEARIQRNYNVTRLIGNRVWRRRVSNSRRTIAVCFVRGCILIAQRDDSNGGWTWEAVVDTVDETRREMHYQAPRYALMPLPCTWLRSSTHKWALTLSKVQSECILTCDVSADRISHEARERALQNRAPHRELVSLICRCVVKMYIH